MSVLTTLNLTVLGAFHTVIGLFAVAAGVLAFVRHGAITPATRVGHTYIWATLVTVLTGFGIFEHGGFGNPHMLGVLTLLVLGLAVAARKTMLLGRSSPYIETVSYSLSFFFHFIPGIAESFTRLPLGAPLAASPEAPIVQKTVGVLFLIFLAGVAMQVAKLRAQRRTLVAPLSAKTLA